MKKLTIITKYREVRRDPIAYIELNTQPWIVQTSSMPTDTGGLALPWYSTKYATVLMDEDWTDDEAIAYMDTFRSHPVVLELNDDEYDILASRIRLGSVSVAFR